MSLQQRLDDAVRELVAHEPVPGAIVGAFADGEVAVATAGVTDLRTGAPMTPDTLFLFGSVTKVWLTTLLLSLVDEGLVELDAPVRRYLPEFRVADAAATDAITVRMLITHSSGVDAADLIVDIGDDDGAIARYVPLLADKPQLHAPGAFASYNNAGFVVAGRLIEVVTGTTWAEAMRERLFAPLQLGRTCLAHGDPPANTAIGHFPGPGGPVPTSRFLLPHALAPAGSTLLATATDAIAFARDYVRLLSPQSRAAMTTPHLPWPAPDTGGIAPGWWWEPRTDGPQVLSHTGGSLGGVALLAVAPERDFAMVAFVNSTASAAALPTLKRAAFEHMGLPVVTAGPRPFAATDPQRFAGTYRRYGMTIDLRATDAGLELTTKPELDVVADYLAGQPMTLPCKPLDATTLALAPTADATEGAPMAWLVDGARYIYLGGRLARRA